MKHILHHLKLKGKGSTKTDFYVILSPYLHQGSDWISND